MTYDLALLSHYLDGDWLVSQRHPTLPLTIYNYSRQTQYNSVWNEVTTKCRGLVLDDAGNVVASPFPKFFNYEEHIAEGSKLPPIPNETFEVFEKMDGSLGIFFYYERELTYEERYKIWYRNNFVSGFEYNESVVPNFDDPYYEPTPTKEGGWHMATRGSFTSEQAIKGMEIAMRYNYDKICLPGYTYLFEIIYPENRIVVDYGDEERLVLLGIVNPDGGEIPHDTIEHEGWDLVTKYKTWGEDWETLKKEISNSKEGYVIQFSGGMRMKIKGEEYVRLHRILTNFSTKDIWELLKSGEDFGPFLERVPDEFDEWVKETIKDLTVRYENIEKDYAEIFSNLKAQNLDRKEFADKSLHYRHSNILFAMLDGKSYADTIWKIVKPKYEKPFKKDGREEDTY